MTIQRQKKGERNKITAQPTTFTYGVNKREHKHLIVEKGKEKRKEKKNQLLDELLMPCQTNGITALITILAFYPLVIANRAGLMLCGQVLTHKPLGSVPLIT